MKETLHRDFHAGTIEKNYSKVAWFYNLWSALTESRALEKVLGLANIQNGEQILEVAVGTGKFFQDLVALNSRGRTYGLDISQPMLSVAKKLMKRQGADASYELLHGSAYQLPYEDEKFDLLINNYMFDLLPEKDFPKILSEFSRVLKPGGRLLITYMSFGDKWYNRFWYWLAKTFPGLLTGCRPIDLVQQLEKAGFVNVYAESVSQHTFPSEIISCGKGSGGQF